MGEAAVRAGEPAVDRRPDVIRVLHVDDDPVFRRLTRTLLGDEDGLVVESAQTGHEALERIQQAVYDCIVSDHQMPGLSGLELLDEVRDLRPNLPFILLTGRGSEAIASEAVSAGVTDYIQKEEGPDQFATLAHRIRQAVEKRRSEGAAEATQEWYEAVLTHSRDVVSVVDEDFVFLYESPSVEDVLGYEPHERLGDPCLDYVHPEDKPEVLEAEGDPNQADTIRFEYRARTPDGDWLWVETVSTLEPVPEVGGHVAVTRDVSQRKEREERLEVAETAFEEATDALFVLEVEDDGNQEAYRIQRVNEGAEAHSGLATDRLEGRTVADALGPDLRDELEPRIQACLETGEPQSFVETLDHPDLPRHWRATLIPVADARNSRVVGIARSTG